MAYTPNQPSVAQINAIKQAVLSNAQVSVSAATTAAFGTPYLVTGSASFAFTLPAAPTSGEGVVGVKLATGFTGTVTITPPAGTTIDGQASFTMTGGGQSNLFSIAAGATNYDVG